MENRSVQLLESLDEGRVMRPTKKFWMSLITLGFCVVSCAHATTSPSGLPDSDMPIVCSTCTMDIEKATRMYLNAQNGSSPGFYAIGSLDLNDDGYLDVVILQGECTASGFRMLVLGGTEDGLELISTEELTADRVFVSRHTTNGWRDLIVHEQGVSGLGCSVFRFDGLGYVEDTIGARAFRGQDTLRPTEEGVFLLELPSHERNHGSPSRLTHGG